jgi:hypothetical protein
MEDFAIAGNKIKPFNVLALSGICNPLYITQQEWAKIIIAKELQVGVYQ